MKKALLLSLIGLCFVVNLSAQNIDSLRHEQYLKYVFMNGKGKHILPETEWNKRNGANFTLDKIYPTAPGSYLTKARNQLMGGFVCEAVGVVVLSSAPGDKAYGYIGGGFGIIGLILELSGINNIGKAGVAFNQTGIGIRVKF